MVFSFVFQAEDGIRDLGRSRGLGDVYKRQHDLLTLRTPHRFQSGQPTDVEFVRIVKDITGFQPVSYTHLTLPTSDLV